MRWLVLGILLSAMAALAQPGELPADVPVRIETGVAVLPGQPPLAPVPVVADWFRAALVHHAALGTAMLTTEGHALAVNLRTATATLDGVALALASPPTMVNGTLYLPADALAQALDGECEIVDGTIIVLRTPRRRAILRDGLALLLGPDDAPAVAHLLASHRLTELDLLLRAGPVAAKGKIGESTLMHQAIAHREPGGIALLWARGADVNAPDGEGAAPLHKAVERNDTACVEMLLRCGAYVDIRGHTQDAVFTPLHIAASLGSLSMVKMLIAHGADPRARLRFGTDIPDDLAELAGEPGFGTPAMLATDPEIAAYLVAHGAPTPSPRLGEAMVRMRDKAKATQCMNHGRQLAVTLIVWLHEHDEVLPRADNIWQVLNAPPGVLRCTAAPDQPHGIGFNARLAGKVVGAFADPGAILAFADCKAADGLIRTPADIDQTRHDGRFMAVFLDGHAELLPAGAAVRLE